MTEHQASDPAFVIKVEELPALNYLEPHHARPLLAEWINRGTDQKMRPTSINMLLRTLNADGSSPSVTRMQHTAGLRTIFDSVEARDAFATSFAGARALMSSSQPFLIATLLENMAAAEHTVAQLQAAGVPADAISLLCRAGDFTQPNGANLRGHSKGSVAAAVASGGIVGALLGIGVLAVVPGIGAVAAAGAIVASSLGSVASVSAVFGATGGAILKMLSDHDVDGREINYYERQIRLGRVFVSVDTRIARELSDTARKVLKSAAAKPAKGAKVA